MAKQLLVATAVLAWMGAGCSSDDGMGGYGAPSPSPNTASTTCTSSTATATTDVSAADFRFAPACIKVTSGQTVTWTNDGGNQHTVTSDSGAPAAFDSGTLNVGQKFAHAFPAAGTYHYHCNFHASMGMVGTVIVQ